MNKTLCLTPINNQKNILNLKSNDDKINAFLKDFNNEILNLNSNDDNIRFLNDFNNWLSQTQNRHANNNSNNNLIFKLNMYVEYIDKYSKESNESLKFLIFYNKELINDLEFLNKLILADKRVNSLKTVCIQLINIVLNTFRGFRDEYLEDEYNMLFRGNTTV